MSTKEKSRAENYDTLDQLAVIVDFLRMLPRMWVWILILVVGFGGLFYVRAYMNYVPVYTAQATFTINIRREQSISGSNAYYDNAAAERLALTFPRILTGDLLLRMVAKDLGEPVTGSIRATQTPDTNLLTLSVTDRDPQKAYDTLTSVIENYPTVSERVVGKVNMNILDESGVPRRPDNKKVFTKNALQGACVGLIIGLVWSLLVFLINRTVQCEADIKKKLSINSLGVVPRLNNKKRSQQVTQYMLLTEEKAKEILQEPFRMIKNKVEYQAQKLSLKTLLITSATAGEGKSLFAANLALSLVASGKKVVLIDCDLRHPTGRVVFCMEENAGLAEYLKEETSLLDYLACAKEDNNHGFPNFLFLPGGAPVSDGSNLLSSQRMKELIMCMEAKADYVILDSAPTGLLTDSAVLAKYADGAIMVIRKEVARIDFIMDALGHLSESDIQIVGGVLNDV